MVGLRAVLGEARDIRQRMEGVEEGKGGRESWEMKGMESDLRLLLGLVVLYWQLENWSELSFWMVEMLWGD